MILRNLAEAIKQQSWFTVFLEILIVVVGIFVGLQVDAWNEERKLQVLERQYLVRLRDDITRSIAGAEGIRERLERQYDGEEFVLETLRTCQLDDLKNNVFSVGLHRVGQFEPEPLVRGTINELVSTGQIGILSDIDLRIALSEIVREADARSGVLGYIVQRSSAPLGYVDSLVVRNLPAAATPLYTDDGDPAYRLDFEFSELCKDSRFKAAISIIQFATRVVMEQNETAAEEYRAVLKTLNNVLEMH